MFSLSVPKPCTEDWDKMTPNSDGRFCNVCSKTVIDFTVMTDDQVKNYFLVAGAINPCGRFNNNQLRPLTVNLPANIMIMKMAAWKKFLAAVLIVFSSTLFSCNTSVSNITAGNTFTADSSKPAKNKIGREKQLDKIKDTTSCQQPTMGIPIRKDEE